MKFNIGFQHTLSAIIMAKIIYILPIDYRVKPSYLKILCFQGITGIFFGLCIEFKYLK